MHEAVPGEHVARPNGLLRTFQDSHPTHLFLIFRWQMLISVGNRTAWYLGSEKYLETIKIRGATTITTKSAVKVKKNFGIDIYSAFFSTALGPIEL